MIKNPPINSGAQETWAPSLSQEDPLEEEMATHSSTLVWRISRAEEPGRLQSTSPQGRKESIMTEHSHRHAYRFE